ncbi:MAG: type II toxin-antitoxin system VapC family toxin [Deltaproteobacteria bacterium]|nr:type II toxin-antitoxin system VapC family toxin [Deltaproteobacteria bacterium]
MKLLLDTHIILWSTAEPERLPPRIIHELADPHGELWFSPISVWEILVLAEKKRILLKGDRFKAVRRIFKRIPIQEAPLNREVAIRSRQVDLPHQDPADRFLAATALVYNLTLVTADKRIIEAESVPVLSAL